MLERGGSKSLPRSSGVPPTTSGWAKKRVLQLRRNTRRILPWLSLPKSAPQVRASLLEVELGLSLLLTQTPGIPLFISTLLHLHLSPKYLPGSKSMQRSLTDTAALIGAFLTPSGRSSPFQHPFVCVFSPWHSFPSHLSAWQRFASPSLCSRFLPAGHYFCQSGSQDTKWVTGICKRKPGMGLNLKMVLEPPVRHKDLFSAPCFISHGVVLSV